VLFGTHGTSVIRDERDPDPDRRYKMFYLSQGGHHDEYRTDGWTEERLPRQGDAYCVAFSSDGIHWKRYEGTPIGPASDAPGCVFWDPYRQQYRSYMRTFSRGGRSIGIMESTDFVKWSKPATIFAPDKDDWALEHQYYGMHVWMEGPLYVGIVWIFDVHDDSAGRGKTWPELVTSRDGRHFTRVGRGRPFIPLGPAGGWDTGGVYLPYNPVAKDRELLFYYSGYKARHPRSGNAAPDAHSKRHWCGNSAPGRLCVAGQHGCVPRGRGPGGQARDPPV